MLKRCFLCVPSMTRSASLDSKNWLDRRFKDKYVLLAKTQNYRCRSAYKLIEINQKYKIIKPGMLAVDLGAAPGSWTQVLVEKTNASSLDPKRPTGKVIAVDRLPIHHIEHATILSKTDFTIEKSRQRVLDALNNSKVNLVVSDMAPNATGIKALDQESIYELARTALNFAVATSNVNATFLVKIWDGGHRSSLEKEILQYYSKIEHVRPQSTQTESTELFLLARGLKACT